MLPWLVIEICNANWVLSLNFFFFRKHASHCTHCRIFFLQLVFQGILCDHLWSGGWFPDTRYLESILRRCMAFWEIFTITKQIIHLEFFWVLKIMSSMFQVHGIIYVIDASDPSRINESCSLLEQLLTHEKLKGKPLLLYVPSIWSVDIYTLDSDVYSLWSLFVLQISK